MGAWQLHDFTKKGGGYLQLTLNGQRVCDFFPFARGSDEHWVRAQAQLVLDTMNGPSTTFTKLEVDPGTMQVAALTGYVAPGNR